MLRCAIAFNLNPWLIALAAIAVCHVSVCMQAKEPQKNEQQTTSSELKKWSAEEDILALNGRWQLTTDVDDNAFDYGPMNEAKAIMRSIFVDDSILVFSDGRFAIEGTKLSGTARNDMNRIKNRPANNRWMNTDEPQLKLSLDDNISDTLSYVVSENQIHFRYPPNSCSRSGVRFSFTRQTKAKPDEPEEESQELNTARLVHKRASELIKAGRLTEATKVINDWTSAAEGRSMPKLMQKIRSQTKKNEPVNDTTKTDLAAVIAIQEQRVLNMVDKADTNFEARKFNAALRRLTNISDQHQPEIGARIAVAELMKRINTLPDSDNRIDGTILTRAAVVAQHARYLSIDGKHDAANSTLNEQLIPLRSELKENDRTANVTMQVRAMVELLVVARECGNENCKSAELGNLLDKYTSRIPDPRFVDIYMQLQFQKIDEHMKINPEFSQKVLSETEVRMQKFKDMKSFGNIFTAYDQGIESRKKKLEGKAVSVID